MFTVDQGPKEMNQKVVCMCVHSCLCCAHVIMCVHTLRPHVVLHFLLQLLYKIAIIVAEQKRIDFKSLHMSTSLYSEFKWLMAWVEITEVFGI